MRKLSAMFAGLFVAAILIVAVGATTASAHQGGETFTFGACVTGGAVEQPGINGTGILGDFFYGPFNLHVHNAFNNPGQGQLPFDFGISCS